jgi:pilus assembly protein Flp/PilA
MTHLVARFLKNEDGATAIEYALIAAIVGIGIIAALGPLTNAITGAFNNISTALNENTGG